MRPRWRDSALGRLTAEARCAPRAFSLAGAAGGSAETRASRRAAGARGLRGGARALFGDEWRRLLDGCEASGPLLRAIPAPPGDPPLATRRRPRLLSCRRPAPRPWRGGWVGPAGSRSAPAGEPLQPPLGPGQRLVDRDGRHLAMGRLFAQRPGAAAVAQPAAPACPPRGVDRPCAPATSRDHGRSAAAETAAAARRSPRASARPGPSRRRGLARRRGSISATAATIARRVRGRPLRRSSVRERRPRHDGEVRAASLPRQRPKPGGCGRASLAAAAEIPTLPHAKALEAARRPARAAGAERRSPHRARSAAARKWPPRQRRLRRLRPSDGFRGRDAAIATGPANSPPGSSGRGSAAAAHRRIGGRVPAVLADRERGSCRAGCMSARPTSAEAAPRCSCRGSEDRRSARAPIAPGAPGRRWTEAREHTRPRLKRCGRRQPTHGTAARANRVTRLEVPLRSLAEIDRHAARADLDRRRGAARSGCRGKREG